MYIYIVQHCSKFAHTSGSNEPPVVQVLWVEMRSDDCRSPLNVSDFRYTCLRTKRQSNAEETTAIETKQ